MKMKLKKIENAVVHCRTKEEAEALIKQLCEKEKWISLWDKNKENTCYAIGRFGSIAFYGMKQYFLERKYEITEFSDLIEPEEQTPVLTAEEVLGWLFEHYYDTGYIEAFGSDYSFSELKENMSTAEIVDRIDKWKSEHEPEKKEPEVEWYWEGTIYVKNDICDCDAVLECDTGYSSRESAEAYMEDVLKQYCSEHDGEYIATVERVCRVKKG